MPGSFAEWPAVGTSFTKTETDLKNKMSIRLRSTQTAQDDIKIGQRDTNVQEYAKTKHIIQSVM
jgi:hypothetical protein